MAIPYKSFNRFHILNVHAEDAGNAFLDPEDYSITNNGLSRLYSLVRVYYELSELEVCHYKGYEADGWTSFPGADKVLKVKTLFRVEEPYFNTAGVTQFDLGGRGSIFDKAWDAALASGRYCDGVSEWDDYPHNVHVHSQSNIIYIDTVDLPIEQYFYHEAWCSYIDNSISFAQSAYILDRGMNIGMGRYTPEQALWSDDTGVGVEFQAKSAVIYFFNPCVNSLSRPSGPTVGGFKLKLYGLGLWNDNDEINEGCNALNWYNWNDKVDYIYIEKLDGTVVATLSLAPPAEFTIASNGELTIQSFPALPAGLYQLRLSKVMSLVGNPTAQGYAGDWRTGEDGRMTAGDRLYFWVYDEYVSPKKPVILTRWTWKKGAAEVFKYYAPIDVRASETFYEGMILAMSPFTRGTNDKTGLPVFPEMEIELDNTTREFSKLLAEYWIKNQLVEVFAAWQEEPEAFKTAVLRGYVYDYSKPTSTWRVRLRDVSEKYFAVNIPKYYCTIDEYPNIHPNHLGKEMPEVLGRAVFDSGSTPGAVETIYVDTAAFKYLAARGSLHGVLNVYADSVLVDPANYAVSYADGGRTYITFTSDQGDAKITFDCEGYSYSGWDSASGYVQNPAYVMLFALAFFTGIPDTKIDLDAFIALAAAYDDLGYGESGYLIIQDVKDTSSVMQQLLWTYGAKMWNRLDGRIALGRKDISDIVANVLLFEQIDALAEPEKPMGFDGAVNYSLARWGHYPTANLYEGAKIYSRQSSIDAFETEIEPASPWDFPWTNSADLVAMRAEEELLKLGFGDQRLKLDVSIQHLNDLDIFDNFRFQDPYAISLLGEGEQGHYYYVEGITYDLLGGTITYEAIDLQWLLRQYFILGSEGVQAATWPITSEADRMYGYLADEATGEFADGEPGKKLIDENA